MGNWMLKQEDMLMLVKTSERLSARSSPTRSRLRRLRRLLPSTWPNTARWLQLWVMLKQLLVRMNKHLLALRPEPGLLQLDQCNSKTMEFSHIFRFIIVILSPLFTYILYYQALSLIFFNSKYMNILHYK